MARLSKILLACVVAFTANKHSLFAVAKRSAVDVVDMVDISAANVHASTSITGVDFQCPAECLECCQPESTLFSPRKWKRFKCVLRDTTLPSGRGCTDPTRRHGRQMGRSKSYCKYLEGEDKPPMPCSHVTKCCCDPGARDDWTEDQCVFSKEPSKKPQPETLLMSTKSGKEEVFELLREQAVVNTKGSCRLPGKSFQFQYTEENVPDKSKRPPYESWYIHRGCCRAEEKRTVTHSWDESYEHKVGTRYYTNSYHKTETKSYHVCTKFEVWHRCSEDGGLNPSGANMYRKKAKDTEGTCLGDKQAQNGSKLEVNSDGKTVCPMGRVEGDWCRCPITCDTDF
eukprot:TRINITY_DN5860_c0_g1_i3.p1 TRINITY_DN5860_c0_g1~~TRINITY_DN5860_c0_g1_i3.p1  ORF type:complete len:341 (-),score=36.44 TRINITY_DN5860_c0_g1_i3:144-1166(-)